MTPTCIPPTEANPEPRPPCGGSWIRDADGGLTPGDADTAQAAGLAWAPVADARTPDAGREGVLPLKRNSDGTLSVLAAEQPADQPAAE